MARLNFLHLYSMNPTMNRSDSMEKSFSQLCRRKFIFRGIVQGVGFRPTVYRCAVSLGLTGFVQNQRSEVLAEIQGSREKADAFIKELEKLLPQAARLEEVLTEEVKPIEEKEFKIVESLATSYTLPPIPPDLAICAECKEELFDPENRRYLYPFITCTQCGPRYSIVEDTPFDRETTSMIDFPQCPDCLKEYTDPLDRRFHSQTNSCEKCGPQLTLCDSAGNTVGGRGDYRVEKDLVNRGNASEGGASGKEDPLIRAIEALNAGEIVAIQGTGGFHLAADPSNRECVLRLRSDKERERKPFALMVCDLEEAERLCHLDEKNREILSSPESPIVILPHRSNIPEYLKLVSDTGTLGIMLPYTPLHLLLFFHPKIEIPYRHLIMTSGNLKGEPIVTEPAEARDKLSGIADLFLFHNRRILFRTDDSVVRITPDKNKKWGDSETTRLSPEDYRFCFFRRSRGYVPGIITLDSPVKEITLAAGGDLKNAPAFARENSVFLSPYIGDLEEVAAISAFERQIEKMLSLYNAEPGRIVYDMHPGYHSTHWAERQSIEKKLQVQHHHAHILSVMAEHNLDKTLGLSFDGTGYGLDDTIWGGEFILAGRSGFERLGCFRPFPLPGGDAAVLNPARIAFVFLKDLISAGEARKILDISAEEADLLSDMIERRINTPMTSSLGRLFDAAAAILKFVKTVSYEGEGPIKMEGVAIGVFESSALADDDFLEEMLPLEETNDPEFTPATPRFFLEPAPLIKYLATEFKSRSVAELALLFHQAVAHASFRAAIFMREKTSVNRISLSGGVFQNMLLRELLIPRLLNADFEVYLNRAIPPGDGGLAVGQIYFEAE